MQVSLDTCYNFTCKLKEWQHLSKNKNKAYQAELGMEERKSVFFQEAAKYNHGLRRTKLGYRISSNRRLIQM